LVRQCSAAFRNAPVISVVVPVYNPPAEYLEAMIASVRVQTYPHWELCLADASTHPHVRPILEKHREQDPRVKVAYLAKNDGIVGNSNAAITLAQGEFLALLDHDDTLAPFALFEVAQAILRSPDADFLYSDEDKLDSQGRRVLPYFKPGWSPDTLRTHNYICHLAVLRRSLVIKIGGFRPGYDGSQDHDLLLRAGEHARQVIHIPQILYHWRMHPNSTAANPDSKTYAYEAGRRAVADHLARTGHHAEVLHGETVGYYQPIYRVHPQPLVSIIVPNRDQPQLLQGCVDAIKQSGHAHFELLIVENGSKDPATDQLYTELARDPRIRILPYSGAFNYSAVNNFAVSQASGELLLFLNNDVRLVDPRWLEVLVRFAVQPGVGAVGAKLLYEDGTIQHAGIALGLGGIAGHMHLHYPGLAKGHMCRLLYSQNVSAVTGACLMTTKSAFEQVGGFDEGFALAYNDVDLCLKLRQAGYRIIWAPDARLTHLESKSRGSDLSPERAERLARESALFQAKWQALLDAGDPYYSPHFRRDRPDFVLNLSQKEQQS
jgi:GT2 family glycosyltransferase